MLRGMILISPDTAETPVHIFPAVGFFLRSGFEVIGLDRVKDIMPVHFFSAPSDVARIALTLQSLYGAIDIDAIALSLEVFTTRTSPYQTYQQQFADKSTIYSMVSYSHISCNLDQILRYCSDNGMNREK